MDLMQKAARLGIAESFTDATGHRRAVTREALERLTASLPVPPERRILPSSLISRGGARASCGLPERVQLPMRWTVLGANGTAEAEGSVDARTLALPSLSEGIHRLRVRDESGAEEDVNLLTVPERAFGGTFDRVWILAVQLYSVRSARNWGIGDFTDLKELLRWSARHGAAGVGLNPLHALFDDHPQDCSPYSPNSRLFLNPLYIDVARLPGCPASFVAIHTSEIERARVEDFVDYRRVAELKHEAMRLAFSSFKTTATSDQQRDFDDYRRAEGARLSRFACFEMLRRKYAGPWRDWPDDWSSPDDDALLALRQGPDADAIEFVEYQQWIAHAQLSECRDLATELGMPIGLYLDIAVGVKADGFDAWNEQVAISRNLSVGAPPDLLNTAGQDWGLAGFNAAGLDMRSYEPFADLLRASMRYAGAIRLDHVLGLNRIYLVPEGCSPREGAYVRMPLEDLLAVTALESVRNSCVVIGEDLGTVPDGLRERLADWGIWSYRVMMFERRHDGAFQPPQHYPPNALVTFNTHDLPTFLGWQTHRDIDVKRSLGIDPGESVDDRTRAIHQLEAALREQEMNDAGLYAMVGYLARSPSRILCLSIDDLLTVCDQPNVPGTINEHPNWRRKLPALIEGWDHHIDADALRQAVGERNSVQT